MIDIENLLLECGLPLLSPSGNKWNARCIVCGDSKKSNRKKRFWVLPSRRNLNSFTCYCHNCGYQQSLKVFIKFYFPDLYKKYFNNFRRKKYNSERIKYISKDSNTPKKQIDQKNISLIKIFKLNQNHDANLYLDNRNIPSIWKKYLFYSDNFKSWINEQLPNKFEHIPKQDRRIIIPFYTREKKIFAVAGRSLDNSKIRYLTIKFDEDHPKIFGLERANFKKNIYIFEGQFDSLFIPNSLAMAGSISSINKLLEYAPKENFILVPDIEPRNKEICNFIDKIIKMNFQISLLPPNLKKYGKDINDIIVNSNMSTREIYNMINQNIVQGIKAKIRFKSWRKI